MHPENGSGDSELQKWLIFLDDHAGKIVIAAWILAALFTVLPFSLYVEIMTRHPRAQFVPYLLPSVSLGWWSLRAGTAVALFSTVAFALKWQVTASLAVISVWTVLALIAVIGLVTTPPGPEQYVQYVGSDRYLVPWQYGPFGAEQPGLSEFRIQLCAETLKGIRDKPTGCDIAGMAAIRPREMGLVDDNAWISEWLKHHGEMERIAPVEGHEGYLTRSEFRGKELLSRFYVLNDAQGNLVRLTLCLEYGCRHHTLVGDYAVSYDAPVAMTHWVETDKRLAELISSWRVAPSR